ncbi:hypothetical protein J6590_031647 [Homalodisca vitripennis]|nr:hypothetical protein J6590_031647 [Homalodisca vitripennis]
MPNLLTGNFLSVGLKTVLYFLNDAQAERFHAVLGPTMRSSEGEVASSVCRRPPLRTSRGFPLAHIGDHMDSRTVYYQLLYNCDSD